MDIQEVKSEIERLEQADTNYSNCSKLAVLYSINDHHKSQPVSKAEKYSFGSSEFLTVASRASIEDVLEVIDEHLEAIMLLHPKEYKAVINKIKEKMA